MEIKQAWYRVSVKGIIYDKNWKFLLANEADGTWDLPWWWLDHGEDQFECLKRELDEEMGLKITKINKTPKCFVTTHKPASKTRPWIANTCYEIEVENLDFKKSDECLQIWFFSKQEAEKLNLLPNVKEFLKLI